MRGPGPRRFRGLDYIWFVILLFVITAATTDGAPQTVLAILSVVLVAGTLLIYWVQFKR
jgi:hypothetical protein